MSTSSQNIVGSIPHDLAKLTISPDGYSAFIEFTHDIPFPLPSETEIARYLTEHGVVFGIESDLASRLSSLNGPHQPVLIAKGVRPVDGKDGWVEYSFLPATESAGQEEKRVDYHDLGWIHNVQKNAALAVIHPPEPGIPGTTVRGKSVAPKSGAQSDLTVGLNAARDPDDTHRVIALEDGNAVLEPGPVLSVRPIINVDGNVDYSTGDIDFVGAVIIQGDVKADFTVKARKRIEVRGNVEDAQVVSGGDVVIRGGFIGQGKGLLTAEGNVHIHHVLNQTVKSGGVITIDQEAISAKLHSRDKIAGPRAVFVGGLLEARDEIEVKNLGNGDEGQAKARVGRRKLLLDRLKELETEASYAQKQVGEVKAAVYKLVKLQLDTGALTPDQAQLQSKLQSAQAGLNDRLDRNQKEKDSVNAELQKGTMARIVVHGTLFPNVMIELNGSRKVIESAIQEVVLTEYAGRIEEKSLQ